MILALDGANNGTVGASTIARCYGLSDEGANALLWHKKKMPADRQASLKYFVQTIM
jgi:hypothetical protein